MLKRKVRQKARSQTMHLGAGARGIGHQTGKKERGENQRLKKTTLSERVFVGLLPYEYSDYKREPTPTPSQMNFLAQN